MNLKQAVFSAGRWTSASMVYATVLQFVQVIVLARMLMPSDFGLMAVVIALIAIISLFADFGLTRALIHYEIPNLEVLSSLYWMNLAISVLLMALLVALAPLAGMFFGSSDLTQILQVACLVLPLTAFGQQFRTLAEKELRFREIAVNEMTAGFIGFSGAVLVAAAEGGVYALLAGMLITAATSSALAWWKLSHGRRPIRHFHIGECGPYLRYGSYMVGESIANVCNRQADIFIGGAAVGPSGLGTFSLPRDLTLRSGMIINRVVTRVGFPVMARVHDNPARLKSIYLQTLRVTASVNFPIFIALGLFADEVVAILYGPRWTDAGRYLEILAAWGLVRSIGQPIGSLLYAAGRARRALWWNVIQLAVVAPVYWAATQLRGLEGLAWAMVATQLLLFLPAWRLLVHPVCGARLGEFLRQSIVPLGVALSAGAMAVLATTNISNVLLRLLCGLAAGAVTYIALSTLFNRPAVDVVLSLAQIRGFKK